MFGERLKSLRKEKNMLQKDLADLLKISPSTIGMYEQGRRDPDTETIKFLADYFNVSTDYLLGKTIVRNFEEITIATHRTDGYDENLPPEALEELEKFKEYLRHKYKK